MKELLIAFLGKTFNLPADSVAEKLYKKSEDGKITDEVDPAALENILALDTDRVKKLKGDPEAGKTMFDNGYKKAEKEISEKWEKDIRTLLSVESEAKGIDLLKEGLSKLEKAKMDDDKVKIHPLYTALEKRASDEKKAIEKDWQDKLAAIERAQARNEVIGKVKGKGAEVFDALKPVLPTEAAKAAILRGEFLDKVDAWDWEPAGDDFIQTKEGKRVEDAHGNPITLKKFVETEAGKRFDFHKQQQAGNGGNKNDPGESVKLDKIPTTQEEFDQAIYGAKTRDERVAIAAAWEKSQKANGGTS